MFPAHTSMNDRPFCSAGERRPRCIDVITSTRSRRGDTAYAQNLPVISSVSFGPQAGVIRMFAQAARFESKKGQRNHVEKEIARFRDAIRAEGIPVKQELILHNRNDNTW